MKRKGFLIVLFLFICFTVYFGEKRQIYCLDDDRCVTIWKTYGNICDIIPGHFYGLFKPSSNHIKTSSDNFVTLYWNAKSSNKIYARFGNQDYQIFNPKPNLTIIEDFNSKYKYNLDTVFYSGIGKQSNEVNEDISFVDVYIKEEFAKDKNGDLIK